MKPFRFFLIGVCLLCIAMVIRAQGPSPIAGDLVVKDFTFGSGEKLAELRLHYRTLGTPQRNAAGEIVNAVLMLHASGESNKEFLSARFKEKLFAPGKPLDLSRTYVILTDAIGHGGSSRPSDGLRMRFPHYNYDDMVRAQKLVVEHLGVRHLRLVLGTSMGCMHTWLWTVRFPDAMDAAMPIACQTSPVSGRDAMFQHAIVSAIRNDSDWKGGDYTAQPKALAAAIAITILFSVNARDMQIAGPTPQAAIAAINRLTAESAAGADANNTLYAIDASRTYDASSSLEQVQAAVLAVNSADDLVNPSELGNMGQEIKKVKRGTFVILPYSAETHGHLTYANPEVWGEYLVQLLAESHK